MKRIKPNLYNNWLYQNINTIYYNKKSDFVSVEILLDSVLYDLFSFDFDFVS